MKKLLVLFLSVILFNAASGAALDDCVKKMSPDFTSTLQSSNINYSSPGLAQNVTDILQARFNNILQNDADCQRAQNEITEYKSATFALETPTKIFDIELQFLDKNGSFSPYPDHRAEDNLTDELESLLPWYGILIVKKGSLDEYANRDVPLISSEYMKNNRSTFYPGNSDKPLGAWRGCTHSNHTANDNDVINRAAHITFDEEDSFWKGNDYYVYDGKDVYWGTAQLVGEIALAILTFGISAEASAAKGLTQASVATARSIQAVSKSVTSVKLVKDAAKIQKAAQLAEAAKAGSSAAAVASRADAIAALADAGVKVNKGVRATQLVKIGGVLKTATTASRPAHWVSSLAHPHRLLKTGLAQLSPQNLGRLYGSGAKWGQKFKRAALTAAGGGIGIALIKAYGYSTAAIEDYAEGVSFNSFGLLSADNLDGRENEISHGAWIMFEEGGTRNDDDTLVEALKVAEALQEDVNKINSEDPQCDIDIYVVQPGIGNPNNKSIGKREMYYLIQNPAGSLRVNLPTPSK